MQDYVTAKHNIDDFLRAQENYIEYQIYKNSTEQKNNSSHTPSNGISTFGAILSLCPYTGSTCC